MWRAPHQLLRYDVTDHYAALTSIALLYKLSHTGRLSSVAFPPLSREISIPAICIAHFMRARYILYDDNRYRPEDAQTKEHRTPEWLVEPR